MRDAQSQRSKQQVLIIAFFVVCVFAAGLVVAPATASANHSTVEGVPRAETYTDPNPDWTSSGWTKQSHNCGSWGCSGDFWVTTTKGATAEWYLPNMQGVYTFGRTLGKHFTTKKYAATGTVKWTVWEWRKGSNSYRRVRTFTPNSQRDRIGWWTYNSTRIELDGAVKIIAEALEDGERVGVQHVRLNHVDLLPEMVPAARGLCEAGVVNALTRTVAVPASLAAAVVIVYAAPLVFGGGQAALTLRAAKVLAKVIPGVTAEDLVKDEIQNWVLERIKSYLSETWGGIWGDAVESYQYGCNDYIASWMYLGITRGYGVYADDLAKTWGARRR